MPSLRDIIPQEFFVPPPVTANPAHGRITLYRTVNGPPKVLVSWERKCPIFDDNLAAARSLKVAGLGNYAPDSGGWLFVHTAAARILDAFPATLVIDPEVKKLAEFVPDVRPLGVVKPKLHGTIVRDGEKWAVGFGGFGSDLSRDQFSEYLDRARNIRHNVQGSPGWNGTRKVWVFARQAAARIVKAFPAPQFDHPADLLKDAEAFPIAAEPAPAPAEQKVQEPATDRLLALADDLLG